jgi:hypothetical protein
MGIASEKLPLHPVVNQSKPMRTSWGVIYRHKKGFRILPGISGFKKIQLLKKILDKKRMIGLLETHKMYIQIVCIQHPRLLPTHKEGLCPSPTCSIQKSGFPAALF